MNPGWLEYDQGMIQWVTVFHSMLDLLHALHPILGFSGLDVAVAYRIWSGG
jgi:hypothetical protein